MSEERIKILEMLEDGKITADEAAKLLETLDKNKTRLQDKDEEFRRIKRLKGKFFQGQDYRYK